MRRPRAGSGTCCGSVGVGVRRSWWSPVGPAADVRRCSSDSASAARRGLPGAERRAEPDRRRSAVRRGHRPAPTARRRRSIDRPAGADPSAGRARPAVRRSDPPPADACSDRTAERERLFTDARRLLRRACAREPMLLVIDDLQCADPSSIALLRQSWCSRQACRYACSSASPLVRMPTAFDSLEAVEGRPPPRVNRVELRRRSGSPQIRAARGKAGRRSGRSGTHDAPAVRRGGRRCSSELDAHEQSVRRPRRCRRSPRSAAWTSWAGRTW